MDIREVRALTKFDALVKEIEAYIRVNTEIIENCIQEDTIEALQVVINRKTINNALEAILQRAEWVEHVHGYTEEEINKMYGGSNG